MTSNPQAFRETASGWYPVSASASLAPASVVPVTLNMQRMALWRSASGHVNAWGDRCPHRGMRLSFGAVRGENLLCPYHGWTFNTAGRCFRMPAHPDIEPPKAACAQRFAVTERDGYVWVNAGAQAEAPVGTAASSDIEPVRTLYLPCPVDAALAALLSFPLHAWPRSRTGAVVAIARTDRVRANGGLVFDGELADAAGHFVATLDAGGLAIEFDAGSDAPRYGMRLFPSGPACSGVHVYAVAPADAPLRDRLNRAAVALRHSFEEGALPSGYAPALAAIRASGIDGASAAHAAHPSDEVSRCTA